MMMIGSARNQANTSLIMKMMIILTLIIRKLTMTMTMIGIGSAVHTTNPMHHPLHRSELCNRIHQKHQGEGDDDDNVDAGHSDVALMFIDIALLFMMMMMTF